jgi:hypothetical protein
VRLKKGERNLLWSTATFLNPIKTLCKELKFDQDVAPLDQDEHLLKVVNFKGKNHMDFSLQPPKIDWENDKEIEQALNIPLQVTTPRLRTTRCVDKAFVEHTNPHRFQVARVLNKVMLALDKDDVLSDELEKELTEVFQHEEMLQKVFYEAHNDWNSCIAQIRYIMEPCCSKISPLTQVCTFMDEGDGSTGKGTIRELSDQSLGLFNGQDRRGYSCVLTQEALVAKKEEKPSELLSNLAYCKHAWVDDFKPSQPLSSNILRNLSGGNFITAARKNKGNEIFKFHGQLLLACNGAWTSDTPFVGADVRRIGGLSFLVRYTREGEGPNERKKDGGIKSKISNNAYFSAWWFYVRVMWLTHHPFPKEDHCEPQCPNTLALRGCLMKNTGVIDQEAMPAGLVDTFMTERLRPWSKTEAKKPSSSNEIEEEFARTVCDKGIRCNTNAARQLLRSKMVHKTFTIPVIKGVRNKSSQASYVHGPNGNVAYTLKEPTGRVSAFFNETIM